MRYWLKVREGAKTSGPHATSAISNQIERGELDAEALVRPDDGGDHAWTSIDEVGEFRAAFAPRKERAATIQFVVAALFIGASLFWIGADILHESMHLSWPLAIGAVLLGASLLIGIGYKWGF